MKQKFWYFYLLIFILRKGVQNNLKTDIKIIAAVIMIVAQVFVVGFAIASNSIIVATGKEYKFKVEPFDPYDVFRGRYIHFKIPGDNKIYDSSDRYAIIKTDDEGFSQIKSYTENKPESDYITVKRNNPSALERYYIDEKITSKAENLTSLENKKDIYVTVRIKNGKAVTTGFYIDGERIEDYIMQTVEK